MTARSNPVAGKPDASAAGPAPPDSGGKGDSRDHRVACRPDMARDARACFLPMTDLGNAERFRLRCGHKFRFCAEIGWFAWDGRRWKLLSEEKDKMPAAVMQAVYATVRSIMFEAKLVEATGFERIADPLRVEDKRQNILADVGRHSELYDRNIAEDAEMARAFDDLGQINRVVKIKPNKEAVLFSEQLKIWARASEGSARINCIAALAKNFDDIVIRPEQLDQDRMAINTLTGTIRIEQKAQKRSRAEIKAGKSEFHTVWQAREYPHDPADLITKLADVAYAPRKRCALYDGFMDTVQPDAEMQRFIDQWGGLSMTGDIGEQKLAFFYGKGRNGKGVTVETWANIAGDYAGSIPIESFMTGGGQRRGDQATPDIARLPGVRFLRVSEPSKGQKLNEGLIKQVTGGDPVDARHLNKGFFTFLPEFKMTISGNNKPKIMDNSHGMWSRLKLVPWDVQIPEKDIDLKLVEKLRDEASGIFNRLLRGLLDLKANGLTEPVQITAATRQYRDDSDPLGRFLSQCCVMDPAGKAPSKELYETFLAWGKDAGAADWTVQGFAGAMRDKGFVDKHSNGTKWLGLSIVVTKADIEGGHWTAVDDDDFGQQTDGDSAGETDPVPGFD